MWCRWDWASINLQGGKRGWFRLSNWKERKRKTTLCHHLMMLKWTNTTARNVKRELYMEIVNVFYFSVQENDWFHPNCAPLPYLTASDYFYVMATAKKKKKKRKNTITASGYIKLPHFICLMCLYIFSDIHRIKKIPRGKAQDILSWPPTERILLISQNREIKISPHKLILQWWVSL